MIRPSGVPDGGAGPLRAAITAAGAGRRIGGCKALLSYGSGTFLSAMFGCLRKAGIGEPFAVVVGAERESVTPAVVQLGGVALVNERYEAGRFTSARLAARWALEEGAGAGGGLLLWPVDCPGVSPATVARLAAEAGRDPEANIVPSDAGRGGHPVVLCRAFLERMLDLGDESNLRELMRDGSVPRRFCAVEDPAILDNVNTPEDHERLLRRRARPEEVR